MQEKTGLQSGNLIRLKHVPTGRYLASLSATYSHPSSSGQQMVVAIETPAADADWLIRPPHGEQGERPRFLKHGDVVRLEHWKTGKNLHSHDGAASPISGQQEVTACGAAGEGDDNDNWSLDIAGENLWTARTPIRLIHVRTGKVLRSHEGLIDANYTRAQQEVSCADTRDDDELWMVAEVVVPTPGILKEQVEQFRAASARGQRDLQEIKTGFEANIAEATSAVTARKVEIEEAKKRIDALAQAAEEASAKAGNEALRAYQAKQACEEHSTFIAQKKGAAEVDSSSIATIKKDVADIAQAVGAYKTQADAADAAIAETQLRIDAASVAVAEAKNRTDTDAAAAAVTKQQMVQAQEAIEAIREQAVVAEKSVGATKASVESDAQGVETALAQARLAADNAATSESNAMASEAEAQRLSDEMSETVRLSSEAQTRVKEYESSLAILKADYETLKKKITDLLPGATSAGLASAFLQQRDRFKRSQAIWGVTFLCCIGGLIALPFFNGTGSSLAATPKTQWASLIGLLQPAVAQDSWDAILRGFMRRLPIVLPIVWLGIYAARQYMLALKMEEAYAYKEALSRAFEGYKEQMGQITIPPGSTATPPLQTLCQNILKALAKDPLDIYDAKVSTCNPTEEVHGAIADAAKELNEAGK